MKGLRFFAVLCIICLLTTAVAFASAPRDVQRHWTGNAVNTFINKGIINSYPDGRFRPDHPITREETAAIYAVLLRVLNPDEPQREPDFTYSDVPQDRWSYQAISYLASKYIMADYSDGTFRPTRNITRAEFANMVYSYTRFKEPWWGQEKDFTDIEGSGAEEAIRTLCTMGVMYGYDDGTFRPREPVMRGEAVDMLYSISGFELEPVQVELPESNVIDVPYISQVYPVYAVVGCEGTSLLMGLKGKGYAQDVSLRTFLDGMPKHSSNPAKGFVGSPYVADLSKRTRTTIYPPVLTQYASQYGTVTDFSDSSIHEIQAEVLAGNPVVIYATLWWETPFYRWYNIEGQQQRLLSNNHVVLITGYDCNTNAYYIADPYNVKDTSKEYRYWIDDATLEPIYNERHQAIVVE